MFQILGPIDFKIIILCYLHLNASFREEEKINPDGLSVAEMKTLRDSSEKHEFQAEVDRMMKLIINSLYKNKEVNRKPESALKRHQTDDNSIISGITRFIFHAKLKIV